MKNLTLKHYQTPVVKVVKFKIESGFAGSPTEKIIVQPGQSENPNPGMNEQMEDGSTLNWNWHVN